MTTVALVHTNKVRPTPESSLCDCVGCIAQGTHAIKVWMPVVGAREEDAHTVSMIAGVKLCEYHADHLGPYDVLDRAAIVRYIKKTCRAKGLLRPDFANARTQKITRAQQQLWRESDASLRALGRM